MLSIALGMTQSLILIELGLRIQLNIRVTSKIADGSQPLNLSINSVDNRRINYLERTITYGPIVCFVLTILGFLSVIAFAIQV